MNWLAPKDHTQATLVPCTHCNVDRRVKCKGERPCADRMRAARRYRRAKQSQKNAEDRRAVEKRRAIARRQHEAWA